MGFRIRKRLKVVPDVWINLSKMGGSLSVGGHGLTTNINRRGIKATVSVPGGISYQTTYRPRQHTRIGTSHRAQARRAIRQAPRRGFWSWLLSLEG